MRQSIPIVVAFGLGVVVAWNPQRPDATTRELERAVATQPQPRTAAVAGIAPDERIGIPPDSVTAARPAPNAGQRRALTRALEQMERAPVDNSRPVSTETTTVFSSAALDAFHQEMNR